MAGGVTSLRQVLGGSDETVLMFTDQKDSVRLYELFGDVETRRIQKAQEERQRASVAKAGGHVVQRIGDALFVAFSDPAAAVRCAAAMHDELREWRARESLRRWTGIRIAVHKARALVEDADIMGDAPNKASRLMGEADEHETVISDPVYRSLANDARRAFEYWGPVLPKGSRAPVEIYRRQPEWKETIARSRTLTGDLPPLTEEYWKFQQPGLEEFYLVGRSQSVRGVCAGIGGSLRVVGRGQEADILVGPREDSQRDSNPDLPALGRDETCNQILAVSRRNAALVVARRQCWVFDLTGAKRNYLCYPGEDAFFSIQSRAPATAGSRLWTGNLEKKLGVEWEIAATPSAD